MRRVRPGEIVAGVAGLALLVVLFLDWYSVAGRETGLSAWDAFTVVDILLALVALLGIATFASQVAGRGPALPVALEVVTTTLALAATLLVLYRIINQPGANDLTGVEVGAWLGAACCLALFLGAWLALSDERARPADPLPPEPERRPTPARS
jgi:hypothetical protein